MKERCKWCIWRNIVIDGECRPWRRSLIIISRACRCWQSFSSFGGQFEIPVTFGGQQLKFRFSSTVGGVIKPGSIQEVYGVDVQIKFGWLGIRQVDRAGDQLTFQAKQFTQSFPVSAFAVSHSCS